MDWLPILISGLGSTLFAVVGAAAFTWFFNFRTELKHRQGIQALVAQELMQNQTTVHILIGELKRLQSKGDIHLVVRVLQRRKQLIPWQQARWLHPDVGVAFSVAELTKLTEWYVKLDHLTYLHYTLVDAADSVAQSFSSQQGIPEDTALILMDQLKSTIDFAEDVLRHAPMLPDSRLEKDRGMKRYIQDLRQRSRIEEQVSQNDHPFG